MTTILNMKEGQPGDTYIQYAPFIGIIFPFIVLYILYLLLTVSDVCAEKQILLILAVK